MDDIIDIDPQDIINANATSSGAADLANQLLVTLTEGVDFEVPDVDLEDDIFDQPTTGTGPLYDPIQKIDIKDFTTGIVGGEGIFDQIMVSLVAHLKIEYTSNRISGAEYTKAYIAAISAGLQTGTTLLLESDKAYWAAVLAQQQAQMGEIQKTTARVQLEIAKAQLIQTQYEAQNAEAQYGLTKMQIAVQDAAYDQAVSQTVGIDYTNTNLLPAQLAQATATTANLTKTGVGIDYNNANILPAQLANTTATTTNLTKTGVGIDFNNTNILPAQHVLIKEQAEVQRAQTLDARTDGQTIEGATGKQKDLWDQQIKSYDFDSKTKLAKIYNDAFVTLRTTDEELPVPEQFDQNSINSIMLELRQKLGYTTV